MEDLTSFDTYLHQRGLLDKTCGAYGAVVKKALPNPADWYRKLVADRPPKGTLQQARAAIAHWLRFQGHDEAEIRGALPPARGRKGEEVRGLGAQALAAYMAAVEEEDEPLRSLLLLLPRTGLRISELCGLTRDNVKRHNDRWILSFYGKSDKHRLVPLGIEGAGVLENLLERLPAEEHNLFPGRYEGKPLSAWTAQEACRRIRAADPLLAGLTPHVLRHTYATRAVVSGVDLASLKALLGHTDIKTTQRYLNPSVDDLASAVDGVEGV